jgi:dsDNA-binding SOS-regulon protein
MIRFKPSRGKAQRKKTSSLQLWVVGSILAFVLALPFFWTKRHFALTSRPDWNPTEVQVVGTRIVTAYATDAGQSHPATFYYRAEAEVQYELNGKKFDTWLPASRTTADRAELQMWLSDKKGRLATVLWNPKKPGEGVVKLKSDIGSNFADFD